MPFRSPRHRRPQAVRVAGAASQWRRPTRTNRSNYHQRWGEAEAWSWRRAVRRTEGAATRDIARAAGHVDVSWDTHTASRPRRPRKQLDRLHRAVDDADATLEAAWLRPGSALRVTRKRKVELDALLAEIVTSESASEDLYRRCFPDKVLVADYKKRLLAEAEAAAATEAERGGAQGGAGQGLSRDSCAAQLFDA